MYFSSSETQMHYGKWRQPGWANANEQRHSWWNQQTSFQSNLDQRVISFEKKKKVFRSTVRIKPLKHNCTGKKTIQCLHVFPPSCLWCHLVVKYVRCIWNASWKELHYYKLKWKLLILQVTKLGSLRGTLQMYRLGCNCLFHNLKE